MQRLILRTRQCPGDVVMLTAAVRELQAAHPGRFQVDVRTPAESLWENNPYLTPLDESDPGVRVLEMHYPLIHHSNTRPYHFLHGYCQYLEERLGVSIPLRAFHGDIHLSVLERSARPTLLPEDVPRDYWILIAGGKYDFTAKWWDPDRFQQVVDHFAGKLHFVQCGAQGDWHPPLRGVTNLVGQTTLRQFVHLMHWSAGVICPVTFAMHLAAAVETREGNRLGPRGARPAVVLGGGREPAHWEAYPRHQYLSTVGCLPCCREGGCWRSRCQAVGDNDRKDRHQRCERPIAVTRDLNIAECMAMITAEDVIRRVDWLSRGATAV